MIYRLSIDFAYKRPRFNLHHYKLPACIHFLQSEPPLEYLMARKPVDYAPVER